MSKAFDDLAAYNGSVDRAVASELDSLAWTVCASWSREDAHEAERQIFGQEITDEWVAERGPVDIYADERDRSLFKLRAKLLEKDETSGLVNQELARSLLERGLHDPLQYQVGCMAHDSDEVDITSKPAFHAVARAYLRRLASHEFTSWPTDIREALAPIVQAPTSASPPPAASCPAPVSRPEPALGRTLYAAFDLRKARKRITGPDKTTDEFATAIKCFELLCGTAEVTAITRDMVKQFRSLAAQLPFRPGKEIKALAPAEQIAVAHDRGLPTLSPPTVGKQIAGVRAMLTEAVEAGWISTNPAAGITVDGALGGHRARPLLRRRHAPNLHVPAHDRPGRVLGHDVLDPVHGSLSRVQARRALQAEAARDRAGRQRVADAHPRRPQEAQGGR